MDDEPQMRASNFPPKYTHLTGIDLISDLINTLNARGIITITIEVSTGGQSKAV